MLVHERTRKVSLVKAELECAFWEQVSKHDLTYAELMSCAADIVSSIAKYAIREERHPDDPDKKGDEA